MPAPSEALEPAAPGVSRKALWVVFAGALVLRLLWVVALLGAAPELISFPAVDGAFYHEWAQDILAGTGLATRAFFAHPLYPHVLAGLYALFGPEPLAVVLFQCVLDAAVAVGMVVLAARWLPSRVALFAGAVWAALWPAIANVGLLETVVVGNALLVLTLVLWSSARTALIVPAGACLAAAALCRGNLLLLTPALLWVVPRPLPPFLRLRRAGGFLAGVLIVFLAVGARNRLVAGEWMFVSGHAGVTWYAGFAPGNFTGTYQAPPFVRPDPRHEQADFHAEAERRLGRPLSTKEVSRHWQGEAWRVVKEDPAGALARVGKKILLIVATYEGADNYNLAYLARQTWFNSIPLPGYGWLLALACLGIASSPRARRLHVFTACLLLYVASLLLFFVSSRLRAPLWVFLTPWAAEGLGALATFVRERRPLPFFARFVPALGLVLVASQLAPRSMQRSDWGQGLAMHAQALVSAGALARAADLQRQALALEPQNPFLLVNAGHLAVRQGDLEAAEGWCSLAARLAPQLSSAHTCLGVARARRGKLEGAVRSLRRAVALEPSAVSPRLNLAIALGQAGQVAEARVLLETLARTAPRDPGVKAALQAIPP